MTFASAADGAGIFCICLVEGVFIALIYADTSPRPEEL
jgi:hypothetical protein